MNEVDCLIISAQFKYRNEALSAPIRPLLFWLNALYNYILIHLYKMSFYLRKHHF